MFTNVYGHHPQSSTDSDSEIDEKCRMLVKDIETFQKQDLEHSLFAKCLLLADAARSSNHCENLYQPLRATACRTAEKHTETLRQKNIREDTDAGKVPASGYSLVSIVDPKLRNLSSRSLPSAYKVPPSSPPFPLPPPSNLFFYIRLPLTSPNYKALTGQLGAARTRYQQRSHGPPRVVLDLNTDPPRVVSILQSNLEPYSIQLSQNNEALRKGRTFFCTDSNLLNQAETKSEQLRTKLQNFVDASLEANARIQKKALMDYFTTVSNLIEGLHQNHTRACPTRPTQAG